MSRRGSHATHARTPSAGALHACMYAQGHGMSVDWWAYGVFLYEMMAGFPPFYDDDPTTTYKKILAGRFSFPAHFSSNARDLIRKLLQARGRAQHGLRVLHQLLFI